MKMQLFALLLAAGPASAQSLEDTASWILDQTRANPPTLSYRISDGLMRSEVSLAPMLEQLANDYGGRVKVAKLEIDRNPKTALAYGVRSAPTMLLFKGGQVQATQTGLVSKAQLTKVIDAAL